MNIFKPSRTIIVAITLSFASSVHLIAIEGVQLSVQSSNVVLSWPSVTNETYIVQSIQAFGTTNTWLTLTDGFPATLNTNLTIFIESNIVQNPTETTNDLSGSGTNGGGLIPPGATNGSGFTFSPGTGFYRVVRDGVHIFGLTNGMVLSGNIQLPIEFAVDSTDEIVGVTFYDTNDNPVIGASAAAAPEGGWVLTWDTPMSFNGGYTIYAELDFATNDPVVSAPVTVTIDNSISFPNYLTQEYGSQMWIYAQTAPNADVEIDVYDETNAYLGSFLPTSDGNGVISFLWDLTDGSGHTFTDTNFTGVFTLETPSVARPAKYLQTSEQNLHNAPYPSPLALQKAWTKSAIKTPGANAPSAIQHWTQEPAWTPNNRWVVAMADLTGNAAYDNSAIYMIVGGNGSPTDFYGVLGTLDPYGLNGNLSPGNNAQNGNVFTLNDVTSRSNLLGYLSQRSPQYENFYFFGHGTEDSIGAYNYPTTAINLQQMAFALGNMPLSYPLINHIATHVYRFVWIDACDTGKANFCEAFGIPAQNLSTNNFSAAGIESRVFLGFKNPTGFDPSNSSGDPNAWPARSQTTHFILDAWLGNQASIAAIIFNAQQELPPNYKLDESAVLYGATDMFGNTMTRQ